MEVYISNKSCKCIIVDLHKLLQLKIFVIKACRCTFYRNERIKHAVLQIEHLLHIKVHTYIFNTHSTTVYVHLFHLLPAFVMQLLPHTHQIKTIAT